MSLTLRAAKGAALTHNEVDDNFTELQDAPEGAETNLGNLGSGITLDYANGAKQRGTVNIASVTLTVPAAPTVATCIRLRLTNSVGSVAITIAGAAWLGWIDGTAPTSLHPDTAKENLLVFDGNPSGWTATGGGIGV